MLHVEIRNSSESKGKALHAKRAFKEGETIFEEDPIISCQFAWNSAYKYLACDHCMRPLETPEQNVRRLSGKDDILLPYPDSFDPHLENVTMCNECDTLYCSQVCKELAYNSYHRTLCHKQEDSNHPLELLLETWKHIHYPPETTNIMLLVRILALIKQSSDIEVTIANIKSFCHRTVNEDLDLAHKLLGDKFGEQLDTLREMTANAITGDDIREFLTPDGFCSLLALIGTNGQGIGTSPLSMWVNAVTEMTMSNDERKQLDQFIDKIYEYIDLESGTFLNTEGSGLYSLQSSCNHSCVPNAEPAFIYANHRLQLRALRDIEEGEEITISYLDECTLNRSRHSRQKELALNYLFICDCEKCKEQSNDADCSSEENMSEDGSDQDDPYDDMED